MDPTLSQENKELSTLININEDACEFYDYAQQKAEDVQIKKAFQDLETLHKNVVVQLQTRVRANGGDAEAEETMVGQAQRFWGALVASVSNDVDETLVSHLEEAEDRCLHSIQDALKSDKLTAATRSVLRSDLMATLRKSHDYMKVLKERMQSAA